MKVMVCVRKLLLWITSPPSSPQQKIIFLPIIVNNSKQNFNEFQTKIYTAVKLSGTVKFKSSWNYEKGGGIKKNGYFYVTIPFLFELLNGLNVRNMERQSSFLDLFDKMTDIGIIVEAATRLLYKNIRFLFRILFYLILILK